jgi:hypothetical protein
MKNKMQLKETSDYKEYFKKALAKTGKSLGDMTSDEKKEFFKRIDASWKAKDESKHMKTERKLSKLKTIIERMVRNEINNESGLVVIPANDIHAEKIKKLIDSPNFPYHAEYDKIERYFVFPESEQEAMDFLEKDLERYFVKHNIEARFESQ